MESDPELDPDPLRPKMLDLDQNPHGNQCGPTTLQVVPGNLWLTRLTSIYLCSLGPTPGLTSRAPLSPTATPRLNKRVVFPG
jgi:hypothetical protein